MLKCPVIKLTRETYLDRLQLFFITKNSPQNDRRVGIILKICEICVICGYVLFFVLPLTSFVVYFCFLRMSAILSP